MEGEIGGRERGEKDFSGVREKVGVEKRRHCWYSSYRTHTEAYILEQAIGPKLCPITTTTQHSHVS